MNIKSQIDAILAEDAGTTVPSGKGPKAQELIDPRTGRPFVRLNKQGQPETMEQERERHKKEMEKAARDKEGEAKERFAAVSKRARR